MIEYPSGNWEVDMRIPGKFVRHFTDFSEKTSKQEYPIRERLYERFFILWFYGNYATSLEGDFVECGVFQGESAYFLAKTCKTNLHLFDSWEGVNSVGQFDNDYYRENKWITDISYAQETLSEFSNTVYHHGEVPFDFDRVRKISLLHLDLSVYEPTKIALENLWSKVVPGGVVIVDFHDDFSTGPKKATIDFFEANNKEITMLPTGEAVVIK